MSSADTLPLETDCKTVKTKLDAGDKFLLLDCREPDEHQAAHIEQAVLIPMSELQGRIGELAAYREQAVIVHCHLGGRSLRVANWLRGQGYSKAQSMSGGIEQWSQEIDAGVPRY